MNVFICADFFFPLFYIWLTIDSFLPCPFRRFQTMHIVRFYVRLSEVDGRRKLEVNATLLKKTLV